MFPKKGPNPYGQPPQYGAQQPYGKIPGSGGYAASTAAAGGTDGRQFGGNAAQGAVGQYGGPYAAVYGAQKVGGLAGKGPSSSGLPNLQAHQTSLSESSKFSSGAVGSSLGRPNDDYLASRAYVPKLEQYSANYELEGRMYGEQSANIGRRDGFTDLDRRYPDHIPGSHQIHDCVDQVSSTRHQQLLKTPLQPGSDIRQADYFAGRTGPVHQGSQEVGAYGRVEADHHSLSSLGSVSYGGQQQASVLGGTQRTNMNSLVYGQGSSSSGYVMGLPPGRDYALGKSLLHASSESDYRDSILPRVHPGIPMVDERTGDRVCYRRELDLRDEEHRRGLLWEREKEREWEHEQELQHREMEREQDREREHERLRERERERGRERERVHLRERREKERERDRKHVAIPRREHTPPRTPGERRRSSVRSEKPLRRLSPRRGVLHRPRSPVKQIKREYICKIFPFRLVDAERDYSSLTKRYPRLVISPDVSKVVLNWPKGNLDLSMRREYFLALVRLALPGLDSIGVDGERRAACLPGGAAAGAAAACRRAALLRQVRPRELRQLPPPIYRRRPRRPPPPRACPLRLGPLQVLHRRRRGGRASQGDLRRARCRVRGGSWQRAVARCRWCVHARCSAI